MTVSGVGTGAGRVPETSDERHFDVAPTTGLDLIAELIINTSLENEASSREASSALRDAASSLGRGRVEHMRESADWRLAAGLASGIASMGAAVAKGASTAAASASAAADSAGAASGAASGAEGGAADALASAGPAPAVASTSDGGWDAVADGAAAGGGIAGAGLTWGADTASASAARDESLAADANGRAADHGSDAEAAEGLRGRMLESLARSVEEKRRAEEAATRA